MQEYTDIEARALALQFVQYLAQDDMNSARQLLMEKDAKFWSEDKLIKQWLHSLDYQSSTPEDIEIIHDKIEHDDMRLWPSSEPEDIGWVYIPILTSWSHSAISVIAVSTRQGVLLRNLRFEEPR